MARHGRALIRGALLYHKPRKAPGFSHGDIRGAARRLQLTLDILSHLHYSLIMRKTFKYRLYPTKGQLRILNQVLEDCRWVYNQTLAMRKDAWEQRQESIRLYDTQALLPIWKTERPSLKRVHSQVLQNVQVRVDLAFKAFFRRCKAGEEPGYPRFKGYGRYDSITYPQSGFKLAGEQLQLSKVGSIHVVLHRSLEGEIKTLTLRRSSTGKWYACFSVEVGTHELLPDSDTAVGLDMGLMAFATLSTGKKVENPRFFRTEQKELAKAQRKLEKEAKGTPDRALRRKAVSRVHERIRFRRDNFAHQESRKLVDAWGFMAFEDLDIKGMMEEKRFSKSIGDAAWRQFVQYTVGKAEYAGRRVVLVNPRNTSKMCSRCGALVEKPLSERTHRCGCGLVLDRDHNAAINILRLGLQAVASA